MAESSDDLVSSLIDISETLREKAMTLDSSDNSRDIIDRSKALQKNMRKKKSVDIKVQKDDIEIAFCEMTMAKNGVYHKSSPYYEVPLKKRDFYKDVVSKASSVLQMDVEDIDLLSLFRASGIVIADTPLTFGKSSSVWTMGRYLNKLHTSPDKLHLGIGVISGTKSHNENVFGDAKIPASKRYAIGDSVASSIELESKKTSTESGSTSAQSVQRSRRYSYLSPVNDAAFVEIHPPPVMSMTSEEVKSATQGFDESIVIGKGGFGVVCKVNNFRSAGTTVAIKVLNKDGIAALKVSAEIQLESEVFALTKFRHPNVVDMMAYACTDDCCAIVYTYMYNGSLFDKLHKEKGKNLSWPIRRRILIDSCRGLAFLHASSPPLVHQDIKSSNILLDEYYSAKISDFGFAIDLPQIKENKTMVTAPVIARTEGYFPPELTTGKFSDKSDVYSYGVVALETFTGLQAYVDGRCDPKLTELTEDDRKTVEGFTSIYDNKLSEPDGSFISEVYEVVCKCLQRHSKRPKSSEVLQIWEKVKD